VKRELNPKMLYFGTPVVLVSSRGAGTSPEQWMHAEEK